MFMCGSSAVGILAVRLETSDERVCDSDVCKTSRGSGIEITTISGCENLVQEGRKDDEELWPPSTAATCLHSLSGPSTLLRNASAESAFNGTSFTPEIKMKGMAGNLVLISCASSAPVTPGIKWSE